MSHRFSTSSRTCGVLMVALGLAGMLEACGPGAPRQEPAPEMPATRRQGLTPNLYLGEVAKNRFEISWRIDRTRDDIIRGYNVYVSRDSGLSGLAAGAARLEENLYTASTYPGDTDGDITSESIGIEGVETGVRYYVHVRTVFLDGQFSPPSDEIEVIPRPRGQFDLSPRFSGRADGFSFEEDGPVPGDSERNDVYLYGTSDGTFLASPSRLDRGLRHTRFVDLGPSVSLDDYTSLLAGPRTGEDKLGVQLGHSIGLILTGERVAKLRPLEIGRSQGTPHVLFEYVYQPVMGETRF